MDPRPPVPFGPLSCDALVVEDNAQAAAAVFRSLAMQAAILLTAILSLGIAGLVFWVEMIRYEAALAACARV